MESSAQYSTSIQGIINSIPLSARACYETAIRIIEEKAEKSATANDQAMNVDAYRTNGQTLSAFNSIKTPTIQLSREFMSNGSLDDLAGLRAIEAQTTELRNSLMSELSLVKWKEVLYYRNKYLDQTPLKALAKDTWKKALEGHMDGRGVSDFNKLPQLTQKEFLSLQELGTQPFDFVIGLVNTKHASLKAKRKEKKEVKEGDDIEMADTGKSSKEWDKSMGKMVESYLEKKRQSMKDKARSSKVCVFDELRPLTDLLQVKNSIEKEVAHRLSYQSKIGEEAATILFQKRSSFGLGLIDTYPEIYFQKSMDGRILFLRSQMSSWDLNTLRSWHPGVHKQINVSLPKNIEYFLALNLKFVYPQVFKYDLPTSAYDDVVLRVRNWYAHRNDKEGSWKHISSLKRSDIPKAPAPASYKIEEALRKGRTALEGILEQVVPTRSGTAFRRQDWVLPGLSVTKKQLRDFLSLNQYMIFITDKNLGIAVVTCSWYKESVLALLNTGYTKVPKIPVDLLRKGLGTLHTRKSWMSPQIIGYLRQSPMFLHVPNFHGIPKVHKDPWKLRPIVPMHSFCTGNISKIVHTLLAPFLEDFPTICQSSREFVVKLRNFTSGKHFSEKWTFYSVDVVSMYTNILTAHLLPCIRWTLNCYSDYNEDCKEWILRAVEFINENVFFQFEGQFYHQDQGIAMGTATGPVLANLFMAFYENYLDVHRMGFYIRYIDDIFIYSDKGLEECQQILRIPGIDFTWESGDALSFLDVWVHKHGNEVCWRPFSKRLNHYQYLPWVSSHPLSVKKGLVKTELIRMATLSKKQVYFAERRNFLMRVLAWRGYPDTVLRSWGKQVEWRESGLLSYERKKEFRSFFLAASEYNPVWDSVRLQPVWEIVIKELGRMGPDSVSDTIPKLLVRSLSRTWNLWDEVRRVNKNIVSLQSKDVPSDDLDGMEVSLPLRISSDESSA